MMAPVPGNGLRVPMLASGDAAGPVAATLRGYGADIEVLDGPAGLAATRKLLRSVFYKGMAASIVEALEAARAAGLEDWLRPHIAEDLAKADASTVERIVTGTRQHAVRRGHEMAAAAEMLTDLGVQPDHGRRQPRPARAPGREKTARPADNSKKHLGHMDLPQDSGPLCTSGCTQRSTIFAVRVARRDNSKKRALAARHHAPFTRTPREVP